MHRWFQFSPRLFFLIEVFPTLVISDIPDDCTAKDLATQCRLFGFLPKRVQVGKTEGGIRIALLVFEEHGHADCIRTSGKIFWKTEIVKEDQKKAKKKFFVSLLTSVPIPKNKCLVNPVVFLKVQKCFKKQVFAIHRLGLFHNFLSNRLFLWGLTHFGVAMKISWLEGYIKQSEHVI